MHFYVNFFNMHHDIKIPSIFHFTREGIIKLQLICKYVLRDPLRNQVLFVFLASGLDVFLQKMSTFRVYPTILTICVCVQFLYHTVKAFQVYTLYSRLTINFLCLQLPKYHSAQGPKSLALYSYDLWHYTNLRQF